MGHDNGSADPRLARAIEAQIETLQPGEPSGPSLKTFARLLFAGRDSTALAPLEPSELALFAAEVFAEIAERPPAEPKVGIRTHTREPVDLGPPLAVLQVLNDDMPFLVDSVMGEINGRGLNAHLVLHPILMVRRAGRGRLKSLLGRGDRASSEGKPESLIVILLDQLSEAEARDLVAALKSVLADVHAAVADWQPMLARLDKAINALERGISSAPQDLLSETIAFCRWLRDGQLTFLGMREYRLDGDAGSGRLEAIVGSGLGLLRDPNVHVLRRGRDLVALTPEIRRFFFAPQPIIITKASVMSRVHRRTHMDYVGLKTYGPDGALDGELRIVGLFTSKAYTNSPQQIPFLRLKVDTVVSAFGFPPDSHDGKALLHILETFPRNELFQIGVKQLTSWAKAILDLELRPRVCVLTRVDRFDRFVSALVFVPRDRFSTSTREKIAALLAQAFDGQMAAFEPVFLTGPLVRVHYIIARYEGPTPVVSEAKLETLVADALRTWDDALSDALRGAEAKSGAHAAPLRMKYARAFSAGYAENFSIARAIEDIARIERLGPDRPVAIDFYREAGAPSSRVRVAIYRFDEPIPLSERVPVIENLGFRVIDERSYRILPELPDGRRTACLHDMVLESAEAEDVDLITHDARLEECFLAVFGGQAENDSFNRLVIRAAADWREAAMLRAYAAYLRQIRSPFSPRYIAETLIRHASMTRDLIELFHIRFDPDRAYSPEAHAQEEVRRRYEGALARVPGLDEDRILRQLLGLIDATVRTSYFQIDGASTAPPILAFKLASKDIEGVPEPKPFREIWVYAPRVEGVHLRFAPIARGGLRWSDRTQDFRTEILGLARAQQVKNTVIVPQGAKGGFVAKRLPQYGSREEIQKEGVAAYRLFVRALLALTDNIMVGTVMPPARVVRHDGDDPYLVVAADKGTATFSDIANEISAERGFWLGDAFASGGSAGYDHKGMGITARGAWECVKRHFREMDHDIQSEPFRVIGVGDMSGDVFGNGMLLSPAIRLVAAFDHRDIFIDPNPDPATSFAERKRLFGLPRSSWQDYDRNKISNGGGVFSRSLKSIPLSDEMRAALDTEERSLTVSELIRTALKAPADLLWFGGIGTYVRASTETDEQTGDRANDTVRVSADEVRAKVIGEGANLAVTQRARIELATLGARINTDFIDNSAGVNTSDQEVNIKIALGPALQSGRLTGETRKALLSAMTQEVAAASLKTNYDQSLALTLACAQSACDIGIFARTLSTLEARRLIDRKLEALPSNGELESRRATGRGLTRPELAVLMSQAKIALSYDLLGSDVPDEPALEPLLLAYFPQDLRERFPGELKAHKLRREIIATSLTNMLVNRCGPAFIQQLGEETGFSSGDIARAFVAAEAVFDLERIWSQISALDGTVPSAAQLRLYPIVQRLLASGAACFARAGIRARELQPTIERHRAVLQRLVNLAPAVLTPRRQGQMNEDIENLIAQGVPPDLSRALALRDALAGSPDIAWIVEEATVLDLGTVARTYFEIGDALSLGELKARAEALRPADPYDRLAIRNALDSISAGQRVLTKAHLAPTGRRDLRAAALEGTRQQLSEIAGSGELTISRLVVAAARVGALAAM